MALPLSPVILLRKGELVKVLLSMPSVHLTASRVEGRDPDRNKSGTAWVLDLTVARPRVLSVS